MIFPKFDTSLMSNLLNKNSSPVETLKLQKSTNFQKSSSASLIITPLLLLAGVCVYFFLGSSKGIAKESSTNIRPLAATYPVVTEFKDPDIRQYRRIFREVNRGWMPSSKQEAKGAATWQNHLGPLGIRTRSYASQLQKRAAFRAIVPKALQDQDGKLALTAAEVAFIAPGSPAEGHLKVGDLIVAIEGEYLKSGNSYRPDWKFIYKDARELQLMLGEKIDLAQARGDIRFTVLRYPDSNQAANLNIVKQTLWSGKGGNQSVGTQAFDIAIPENSEGSTFFIETNKFDNSIAGDGSIWLGLTFEGDYGTKSFLSIPRAKASSGHGGIRYNDALKKYAGKTYSNSIGLHAQGYIAIDLPKGTKRFKGAFAAASYGKVQPFIKLHKSPIPLTGEHLKHLVNVRFPIGKTGSFSATYPRNCPKSAQAAARHAEWLASQQKPDGSWPRLAGYTTSGWDTSWCGLALLSSGNSKYDEQIRKAAYYIAYDTAPSEWTAERAIRVIFLSEYYLRYEDRKISEYYLRYKDRKMVAGIQAAFNQLKDCAKTDYMAGHKVNGFGYGIAGQHYGTGHLALATAVASRTPITINPKFLDGVIQHAGEVCVNGKVPYGRGARLKRDDSRKHGGGNAMSGPMMLGAMIAGGNAESIKAYLERLEASIGDGDNSHASSSLAFIFASLSMAAENEELFLKHMQNFKYKMTIDDLYAGGYMKSAFPLDLSSGDNVTANWIRTAGRVLILNSLKKNLVITGNKKHWAKSRKKGESVTEWGAQVHTYYLRNACIAKELLGKSCPPQLNSHIKALHALPRDISMVPNTRDLILKNTPSLVKQIASNRTLKKRQRAYAIELLTGLDFVIRTIRKKNGEQVIKLQVKEPLHMLNWLDKDKKEIYKKSPYPLNAKVSITSNKINDPIKLEVKDFKKLNFNNGNRSYSFTKKVTSSPESSFKGEAKIQFSLGSTRVSYTRPLFFNQSFTHPKNSGKASNNINLRRFLLKLRMAPRAIFQSQPLIIGGIPFDCMYPYERMVDFTTPEEGIVNIHAGDRVIVDMASETPICGWVHQLKMPSMSQVITHKAARHKIITGKIEGNFDKLYDTTKSSCRFIPDKGKKATVLEYKFNKPTKINGLDITARRAFVRVWYKKKNKWVPITWDNYSSTTSHTPSFPATTAKYWRVEVKHTRYIDFHTLRFYYNKRVIDKHRPFSHTLINAYPPAMKPQ